MTVRRFALEPPNWRIPDQTPSRTVGLLTASAVWLLLYLWLGWRLWHSTNLLRDPINLALAILCVLLGVAVALGWVLLLPRWQAWDHERRSGASWAALTVEEAHQLTPSDFDPMWPIGSSNDMGSPSRTPVMSRMAASTSWSRIRWVGNRSCSANDTAARSALQPCAISGTMIDAGAVRAYLVTSGRISRDTYEWVGEKAITLIDGERLAELAHSEPALDVMRRRHEETR